MSVNLLNQATVQLTTINCGECGGTYALNERYRAQKHTEGGYWNCPYCKCSWGYGEGANAKLKKQLAEAERLRDWHKARQADERAARERVGRQLTGQWHPAGVSMPMVLASAYDDLAKECAVAKKRADQFATERETAIYTHALLAESYEALKAERDALKSQLESAQKDAERLRAEWADLASTNNDRYHDCSDYERGYGHGISLAKAFARRVLSDAALASQAVPR